MTHQLKPLRFATALLLASAALPSAPALAQEAPADQQAQQPTTGPDTPVSSPPVTSSVQASEPVVNTRASGREPADPGAAETKAAAGSVAAATRPATRRPARAEARSAVRSEPRAQPRAVRAPVPAAAAPVAAAVPAPALAPVAAAPAVQPAPLAPPPTAPTPAPQATVPAAPVQSEAQGNSIWPWLLLGALALAGLLLFARRRRADAEDQVAYHEAVHEPVHAADATAHHRPVLTPANPAAAAAALAAATPLAAPAPAAAGAHESGRPWLDMRMRPVRAGVGEDAARVEFALDIQNTGSAHASDVRVSTWMLPARAEPTEVERMLIERPTNAERRETELAPGEAARLETEVAFPRDQLSDAVLPVVVADARYRLPDGSEGRTALSFAVGVPDGEELVMFDVENPSGMHEGVEARLLGEPKRD